MAADDAVPNRFVHLGWDRGHETFDAFVWASSEAGVVVSYVGELAIEPGYKWIRADEVLDIDDLPRDHPSVRLATLRGASVVGPGSEFEGGLDAILDRLRVQSALVLFHSRRTGSGECLVGRVREHRDGALHLDEVDADARPTGVELEVRTADVISIEWGVPYLTAIAELLAAEAFDTGG